MFFLADIALILELFGFCLALVLIHQGSKEGGLVRSAGVILLIGSIFLAACTSMSVYKKRGFLEKKWEEMKQERSEHSENR